MQRFFTFVFLLSLALPVGISISGCTSNPDANYCNNTGHGVKKGTVYTISLTPVQGISLAYAQTGTVTTPTAADCTGATASASSYTYQTDNPNVADISPAGSICAGTWNKFSGGGIPDYTVCTAPTASALAAQTATGLPVHLWASTGGVSSNKIPVYIHAPISSLQLSSSNACVSQSSTQSLGVQAYSSNGGCQVPLCGTSAIAATGSCPAYAATKACSDVIGSLSYSPVNSNIATVDQFGVITAKAPGSTAITATLSNVSSTVGYFTTCPPTSFTAALPSGGTSGTITNGVSQTLSTTAKDVNGTTISGLTLNYTSTIPANVAVSSAGTVSSTYPGTANIYAFCQPSDCNSSPLDKVGYNGTGQPIVSNQIQLTAAGSSSTYLWIGAPNKSQYFVPVNLQAGSVGSPVRLPYMPNSMVLDQSGTNLYFGSYRELMTYSASTNALSSEDINVPGVVLAVSPDNTQVLINDQLREVLYLYSVSGKTYTSLGGYGTKAAFTPDSKTLYIVGPRSGEDSVSHQYDNKLFVYSSFTGWHTYDLSGSGSSRDIAITVPQAGAYFAGTTSTVARSYCWDTANASERSTGTAYPPADSVSVVTDHLAATPDGKHILGASLSTSGVTTLTDIGVTSLGGGGTTTNTSMIACPATGGLKFTSSPVQTPVSSISASAVNQVISASNASIAFVTYSTAATTTGAALPYYKPTTAGSLGTLGTVTLAGSATAPVGGVFSPDNSTFFVGTSGDNLVHYISTSTLKDTTQINPKLVDANGNAVAPTVLWSFPRAIN